MKITNYIIVLFLTVVTLSCAEPSISSFERDNISDPANPAFTIPSPQSLTIKPDPERNILIQWQDTSDFIEGYVLERIADNEEDSFSIKLGEESKEYLDTDPIISKSIQYRLKSFVSGKDSINASDWIESDIDFGEINVTQQLENVGSDKEFEFNWEFENDWYFGIIFEVYNNNELVKSDTIHNTEVTASYLFTPGFNDLQFKLKGFITELDMIENIPFSSFESEYNQKAIFGTRLLSTEIKSFRHVDISWEDNSDFEKGFHLQKKHDSSENDWELLADLQPDITTFSDTLDPFGYDASDSQPSSKTIQYRIIAYTESSHSIDTGDETIIDNSNSPEIRITSSTENTVTLGGWHSNVSSDYTLQRKINGGEFEDYDRISPVADFFIDRDLNENNNYTYRIFSGPSLPSNELRIKQNKFLIEKNILGNSTGQTSISYSKDGKFVSITSRNNNSEDYLYLYDLSDDQLIYTFTLPPDSEYSIDESDIFSEKNLIAICSYINSKALIIDFENEQLVDTLNLSFGTDVVFSNDANHLYAISRTTKIEKINLKTHEQLFRTNNFGASAFSNIDINKDGTIIVGNHRGGIILIDSTGTEIPSNDSDTQNSSTMAGFSGSGNLVYYVAGFRNGHVYNVNSNTEIFEANAELVSVVFDDSYVLIASDESLSLLSLTANPSISKINRPISDLACSPTEFECIGITNSRTYIYGLSGEGKWGNVSND